MNGVTTNALAPVRRGGVESGSHPLSVAISPEGTRPSGTDRAPAGHQDRGVSYL
jgi:hypothetical protein